VKLSPPGPSFDETYVKSKMLASGHIYGDAVAVSPEEIELATISDRSCTGRSEECSLHEELALGAQAMAAKHCRRCARMRGQAR